MRSALLGSDLKVHILEATTTWHVQHEVSDCRCDVVCIWYNDNFLRQGCSRVVFWIWLPPDIVCAGIDTMSAGGYPALLPGNCL